MQNGQVESFHGKLLTRCLRVSWFGNLFEARRKIAAWRTEYNQERPHSSLGYRTPEEFAREMRDETGCGKRRGFATVENAPRSHFPTATATVLLSPTPTNSTGQKSYHELCGNRGQVRTTEHHELNRIVK